MINDVYDFFAEAFQGVVIPCLKTLATKGDVRKMREEVKDVQHTVDRIERRFEKVEDRIDGHDVKIASSRTPRNDVLPMI